MFFFLFISFLFLDQGFSTLVETVESAIGVPDPEDLAQERTTVMDTKEPEPEPSEDEAKKKEQGQYHVYCTSNISSIA